MRYTISIILTYVALCAAISAAPGRPFRYIDVAHKDLLHQSKDEKIVNGDATFSGPPDNEGETRKKRVSDNHSNSSKIVDRQRRSLLTKFMEHLFGDLETLHMKPLLAEGANEVNDVGQRFQTNYLKKSENVMLKEGNAGKVKMNIDKSESFEKDLEKMPAEEKNKILKNSVGEGMNEVKLGKTNMRTGLTEKEYKTLEKEVHDLYKINARTNLKQSLLTDDIVELDPSMDEEDQLSIFRLGLKHYKSQKKIANILKKKPYFEKEAKKRIQEIITTRKDIERREKKVMKQLGSHINKHDNEMLKIHMLEVIDDNNWFLHPDDILEKKQRDIIDTPEKALK